MASSGPVVQSVETQVELFVEVDPVVLLHDGVVVRLDLGVGGKSVLILVKLRIKELEEGQS